MTRKEAYRILGLPDGAGKEEIKKRYRQLMMQAHPDMNLSSAGHQTRHAQEINLAYAALKKFPESPAAADPQGKNSGAPGRKRRDAWNAPVNIHAYREREIFHYAEDHEGGVLGNICIARGKYLWTTDEDFPLFLLSIYRCSKGILDETDAMLRQDPSPALRRDVQAELAYLLAQQFMDSTALLHELAREVKPSNTGEHVYHIPSMLEMSGRKISVHPGELLFPAGVRRHRLYLKNQSGHEAGYLSFHDDRLYYIVIPLFEQRIVQVRLQVSEKPSSSGKNVRPGYRNLDLWVKTSRSAGSRLPENLNLQIELLLKKYSRGLN